MIGTEFIDGQGLGNQLFCYVTARAVALENGYEFGTAGQERFAVNIHSDRGMYFMDMDLGHAISEDEKKNFRIYHDAEERLFIGNSVHDLTHGCYVAGADPAIHRVEDNTLLYGNMQDESYFVKYLPQVKEWLKVKKEYDSYEYSRENLCIINMRGGEYTGSPELLINRKYWLHGMEEMKKIRPDMEFLVITDDVATAQKMLPGIEAHHFDIGKDYVTLKNAYYLLLSNSSFACLPLYGQKGQIVYGTGMPGGACRLQEAIKKICRAEQEACGHRAAGGKTARAVYLQEGLCVQDWQRRATKTEKGLMLYDG